MSVGGKQWATSARFHDSFAKEEKRDMTKVLEDYGLKSPTVKQDDPPVDMSGEVRQCKVCEVTKELKDFPSQVKNEKRYYNHVCKACTNGRKTKSTSELQQELIDQAPINAAVALFKKEPKALAVVIKYFRPEFQALYKEELAKINKL